MNKGFSIPAIVVVAYDRPHALSRLLGSIGNAVYDAEEIPLVISIDGEGNPGVKDVAYNFVWKYGEKRIITHDQNLGLRKHVIKCGDLSYEYGSIIMLEEDCFVSINFFKFASKALSTYSKDTNVAGISLYKYSANEFNHLPFNPYDDGYDNFFMQVPSSWGQAWSENQWLGFKDFLNRGTTIDCTDRIPEDVKKWPETSWKKYYYKYLTAEEKFLVYPSVSHSTNFADPGEHLKTSTDYYQVVIENKRTLNYRFVSFKESLNKFDAYFEVLPVCIGIKDPSIGIDLYGLKQFQIFDFEYVYSIKTAPAPIESYGIQLRPIFLNILYSIPGNSISFGRKKDFLEVDEEFFLSLQYNLSPIVYLSAYRKGSSEGRIKGIEFIKSSRRYKLISFFARLFEKVGGKKLFKNAR